MTRYSTLSGEHVSLAGAWKDAGFHGLAMVKAFCSSGAAWMLFFYRKAHKKAGAFAPAFSSVWNRVLIRKYPVRSLPEQL